MVSKKELLYQWQEENKELTGKGEPSISWDDWIREKGLPAFLRCDNKNENESLPCYEAADPELQEVYDYLGLDSGQAQGRQKIKIDNMKAVIKMCREWKRGFYNTWIDCLSIPLGLSTRKVREDYLDPLISRSVIKRTGNNEVIFTGIPEEEKS